MGHNSQYFQSKKEVFKSKLNKLELKSASFEERQKGKLKNVRTLVIYSEYDSASGANKLHARVEKTALSKEEIKRK